MDNKIAGLPKIRKIFDNPAFLWEQHSNEDGKIEFGNCKLESSRKGGKTPDFIGRVQNEKDE